MEKWVTILIGILVFVIVSLGALLYYQNQIVLKKSNLDNVIYSFSLNETGNSPVISCPEGREIQILDAWYELYDPYFQCTRNPTGCASAFDDNGNIIWPTDCPGSDDSDGGTPSSAWQEATTDDGTHTYKNKYCQYDKYGLPIITDPQICAVSNNALGYITAVANGRDNLALTLEDFGPDPRTSKFNNIAYLPSGAIVGQDSSQGYRGSYAHGVYTCAVSSD